MNKIIDRVRRNQPTSPVKQSDAGYGKTFTDKWVDKDYLTPEQNESRRIRRDEAEARFQNWRTDNKAQIKTWDTTLKALPTHLLKDEQDRRLAIAKQLTEIPDELLNFELERRNLETSNRPLDGIDLL